MYSACLPAPRGQLQASLFLLLLQAAGLHYCVPHFRVSAATGSVVIYCEPAGLSDDSQHWRGRVRGQREDEHNTPRQWGTERERGKRDCREVCGGGGGRNAHGTRGTGHYCMHWQDARNPQGEASVSIVFSRPFSPFSRPHTVTAGKPGGEWPGGHGVRVIVMMFCSALFCSASASVPVEGARAKSFSSTHEITDTLGTILAPSALSEECPE